MTALKELVIDEINEDIAAEMFEQAHFLYSTHSIEETVKVLQRQGLKKIADIALQNCFQNNYFN